MMIVVFRSFKVGVLSMVINALPAITTLGVMGWLNVPLNLATAMVPSVAIGIAVDDTIHFMWRMKKEIAVDGHYQHAIHRTLTSVGKPIVTTSILLCAGFMAYYFSGLTVLVQFGALTILTVAVALLVDLLLAPALLLMFKPFE